MNLLLLLRVCSDLVTIGQLRRHSARFTAKWPNYYKDTMLHYYKDKHTIDTIKFNVCSRVGASHDYTLP
eukprot:scaffold382541_cov40-Prasinocladus_malaysianus.AAC.1